MLTLHYQQLPRSKKFNTKMEMQKVISLQCICYLKQAQFQPLD